MNQPQRTFVLRTQLLGMARLSQRAFDDAVKGYQLGSLDFCQHACAAEYEFQEHSRQIDAACRRTTTSSDLRFFLAISRLRIALHAIYNAAAKIARDTKLFLEKNSTTPFTELRAASELVNGLVRLSVVALFKNEASHAETIFHGCTAWQHFEQSLNPMRETADASEEVRHDYMMAILRSLRVAANQTQEMADAILFWLGEKEKVSDTAVHNIPSFRFQGKPTERGFCSCDSEVLG